MLALSSGISLGCGADRPIGKKSRAWGGNGMSESSSGNLYHATQACTYSGPRRFAGALPKPTAASATAAKSCERWAVATTIFEPSSSLRQIASIPGWCLVVAGDKKTPTTFNLTGAVYLSPADQEAMTFEIGRLLRWNHFGRKNLGFLYAIQHGARWVYDFDDDNLPKRLDAKALPAPFPAFFSEVQTHATTVNLYPRTADYNATWPRGYPLQKITPAERAAPFDVGGQLGSSKVGVLQSLADHEPDVDGFYRLHGKLPFYFPKAGKVLGGHGAALPVGTMMPYNAQATMYAYKALWGLLLPITVHGRVTDIWRAYFTQRLMWDVGLRLAFAPPWVAQHRNPHNILGDFNSEEPLYSQAGALVDELLSWKPTTSTLAGRIEELYIRMYEIDLIGQTDVELTQAWLGDLIAAGYQFPSLQETYSAERTAAQSKAAALKAAAAPPPPRAAVCLSGHHHAAVQTTWPTIKANIVEPLGPNTDVFVSSHSQLNEPLPSWLPACPCMRRAALDPTRPDPT